MCDDDYPQTPETIARAKAAREDELRRVHAIDALALLVEAHGAERVHSWIRSLAALKGVRLPCERSLS